MMEVVSYQLKVYGKVQGVGFRYFTKLKANELKLFGWVKNEDDGSVLIYVGGGRSNVLLFLKWCHTGPDTCVVERLDYEIIDLETSSDFRIKR